MAVFDRTEIRANPDADKEGLQGQDRGCHDQLDLWIAWLRWSHDAPAKRAALQPLFATIDAPVEFQIELETVLTEWTPQEPHMWNLMVFAGPPLVNRAIANDLAHLCGLNVARGTVVEQWYAGTLSDVDAMIAVGACRMTYPHLQAWQHKAEIVGGSA